MVTAATEQRGAAAWWRGGSVRLAATIIVAGLAALLPPEPSSATDTKFFRIGTGSPVGTYFPIGGVIANLISNPPGGRACEDGGSCGVPGLIAVAQTTQGSVSNVRGIHNGDFESAFSQADIAFWAFSGNGPFEGAPPMTELRAIARLYAEPIHLVVPARSAIRSVTDLRGKRVSVSERGSGTAADAELILRAYGLGIGDVTPFYEPPGKAVDLLSGGEIDALFLLGGIPYTAIAEIAAVTPVRLVPIDGAPADLLAIDQPFFHKTTIPAGTYHGVSETPTLAVGALWLTSDAVSADLVFQLLEALWHESARAPLADAHPQGRNIRLEHALEGIPIPLHTGAYRFYVKAGLLAAGGAAGEGAGAAKE